MMRVYLKKRIEELYQAASEVGTGASRSKYSFALNELKEVLYEYNRWMQEDSDSKPKEDNGN